MNTVVNYAFYTSYALILDGVNTSYSFGDLDITFSSEVLIEDLNRRESYLIYVDKV